MNLLPEGSVVDVVESTLSRYNECRLPFDLERDEDNADDLRSDNEDDCPVLSGAKSDLTEGSVVNVVESTLSRHNEWQLPFDLERDEDIADDPYSDNEDDWPVLPAAETDRMLLLEPSPRPMRPCRPDCVPVIDLTWAVDDDKPRCKVQRRSQFLPSVKVHPGFGANETQAQGTGTQTINGWMNETLAAVADEVRSHGSVRGIFSRNVTAGTGTSGSAANNGASVHQWLSKRRSAYTRSRSIRRLRTLTAAGKYQFARGHNHLRFYNEQPKRHSKSSLKAQSTIVFSVEPSVSANIASQSDVLVRNQASFAEYIPAPSRSAQTDASFPVRREIVRFADESGDQSAIGGTESDFQQPSCDVMISELRKSESSDDSKVESNSEGKFKPHTEVDFVDERQLVSTMVDSNSGRRQAEVAVLAVHGSSDTSASFMQRTSVKTVAAFHEQSLTDDDSSRSVSCRYVKLESNGHGSDVFATEANDGTQLHAVTSTTPLCGQPASGRYRCLPETMSHGVVNESEIIIGTGPRMSACDDVTTSRSDGDGRDEALWNKLVCSLGCMGCCLLKLVFFRQIRRR